MDNSLMIATGRGLVSPFKNLTMSADDKKQLATIEKDVEARLLSYEKISQVSSLSSEMIAVAHKTVAKGTSFAELAYFLTVCKNIQLNPFNKEVWCYKDNSGNLLVFTGRDGFLARAQKHKNWKGMRSSEVCEKDEFSLDIANNEIQHKIGQGDRGAIIGAYCIVFVKGCESTIEWANIKDYDKGRFTWKDFKADMIKKVAECHALKKAFGITGVVSEYDFDVREGVAYPASEKRLAIQDKSEERLLQMIDKAKSKTDLENLEKECNTTEARSAYDKKFKELK